MSYFFGDNNIHNKSVEKTQTAISQISNQKCMNICNNTSSGTTVIVNSDIGTINDIQKCNVSGASCILKSALSASISSNQTSDQKAKTGLVQLGDNNISNDNYQSIASNTSQFVNETCGNRSENSKTGNTVLVGVKSNSVNVGQLGFAGHSGCVLNNISRAITDTSQDNSQSVTTGSLGGIIGIILAVLFIGGFIWLFMHMHKSHSIVTAGASTTIKTQTNVSDITGPESAKQNTFDAPKYKQHIESFGTGIYVVLFFSLSFLGTSIFFFIDSHTAKKECYGKVSNGAPRPTSTNILPGPSCTAGSDNAECYVPLLPDNSRAYNPHE
jgi:hypothetical protein